MTFESKMLLNQNACPRVGLDEVISVTKTQGNQRVQNQYETPFTQQYCFPTIYPRPITLPFLTQPTIPHKTDFKQAVVPCSATPLNSTRPYPGPFIMPCASTQPRLYSYNLPPQKLHSPSFELPLLFSRTLPSPNFASAQHSLTYTEGENKAKATPQLNMLPNVVPPEIETSSSKKLQEEGKLQGNMGVVSAAMGDKIRKSLGGNAYKRRNVYKSIVQHMFTYIKKNKAEVITVLCGNGFTMRDIEHAFFNINYHNYSNQQKGSKKRSAQDIINSIISGRNIYTYMLRESLFAMLKNLDSGKCGKITKDNTDTYKMTCLRYYNEIVEALHQEAQGKSYAL